jgi:23S rRNA (adenine2503-C2)-methyltransferase
MTKVDLKSLSQAQLAGFIKETGLPAFRTKQLIHWIYEKRVDSISDITEFSKQLRDDLSEIACISNLTLLKRQTSMDGTEKFLFGLEDGESIECVLIPAEERLTLCISSQVGCALGCAFCLTGRLKLKRNLLPHEIVDQVIAASRLIAPKTITNIVLMGMGEPLANFDAVVEALWRMTGPMNIPTGRITLSTSGIVPAIKQLGELAPPVMLAISLNATTDSLRDKLMPINKKYPLKSLLDACRAYPLKPRRKITFEYVLLKGVNDTPADARRLIRLLKGIPSKVNLIPFNPFKDCEYERPDDADVSAFQDVLMQADLPAIVRKSKGQDILAACGQLKARHPG